jgi:4-carboxymuconolactone decarboxylase
MSEIPEHRRRALAVRRQVLSDQYVDRALADDSPGASDFQAFITDMAWGVWTRDGLTHRDRSLLVLAMTAALGRMDEFRLHLGGARRNGVDDSEVDELILQVAAYCGVPAGVSARRAVQAFRAETGTTA